MRTTTADQASSDVSVVLCAYSDLRWDHLLAAVMSIRCQTVRPREIIVVVDHNANLYARAKLALSDLRVIENGNRQGLSGARNAGVAAAQGKIIAFLDDDAVAEPSWLASLLASYRNPKVVAVGGSITPIWLRGQPGWFPEEFGWVIGCSYRGQPVSPSAVRNLIGCNMSFRREVLENCGGFREDVGRLGANSRSGEETELCIRARQAWPDNIVLYVPAARVYHNVPMDRARLKYFCRRCYAEGLTKARITRFLGAKDSLATESRYVVRILPSALWQSVIDTLLRQQPSGLQRAGAILLGLTLTSAGYLAGTFLESLHRSRPVPAVPQIPR